MDEPRDFGLLGDEDDEITSSPLFDMKFNLDINQNQMQSSHHTTFNKNNASIKNNDSSKTFKTISSNNSNTQDQSTTNNSGAFSLGKIKVERPKPVQKMNISPNRPNANSQAKVELKGIDRPRSHSPLKLTGIEEYIQQYEKIGSNVSVNQGQKITMNLKMDDLLANVGKNDSAYQMLADFSVLTGDPDPLGTNSYGTQRGAKTRKRSTDVDNLREDNWMEKENGGNDDDNDDDGDGEDDDEDEDDVKKKKSDVIKDEKGNLNYKFTAVYRKDEATGAFKEQSKTIFESKLGGETATVHKQASSGGFAPVIQSKPQEVPNQLELESSYASNHQSTESSNLAKIELANALAALRNNSKNLESKLEKIETSATVQNTIFVNAEIAILASPMETKTEAQLVPNVNDASESLNDNKREPVPELKKSNDTFFNDILSKSDDLIAQTQNRLERLTKLESINKSFVTKTAAPPPPKPKPMASTVIPTSITPKPSHHDPPTSSPQSLSLSASPNNSLNNSKSLIDLKSTETPLPTIPDAQATTSAPIEPVVNNQVDLLFDLNEQSFTLNTEPIKQGASYFDLIGLSSDPVPPVNKTDVDVVASNFGIPEDLFNLTQELSSVVNEPHLVEQAPSEFKDEILESIVGKEQATLVLNNETRVSPVDIKLESPSATIDILITEPINERDDNNIVPDGYFNLKHEIPKDQSRPHSPSFVVQNNSEQPQQQQFSPTSETPQKEEIPEISPLTIKSATARSRPTTPSRIVNMPSPTIARPRPVSPASRNRAPSPTAAITRSRPSSPKRISPQTIPEDEFITFDDEPKPPTTKIIRKEKKMKTRIYDSSGASSQASESSSDSEDEKIQVKIRPKANKGDSNFENGISKFVPLLPRPPKNAQEVEEFRQRRLSSDTASITHSIKDDESSDEEFEKSKAALAETSERKDSVHSEYLLELPDEDDSLPLSDFNEKCELHRYSDETYGCIVLVRQPFRNATILYKNALQKFTEVRTWTEYLVRLVTVSSNEKKLLFYNAHELVTLATEQETTLDDIVEKYIIQGKTEAPESNAEPMTEAEEEEKKRRISPFHEIPLKATYKFTEMCLQQYDTYSKIHTFKLQEIVFKETFQMRPDRIMALPERFFKKFTKPKVTSLLDHTPLPFEIAKFGHTSYQYLRSFLLLLQDAFWSLPTITRKLQREQQLQQIQTQSITTTQSISAAAASIFSLGANKQVQNPTLSSITAGHTREEVTVKVLDEYKCKLDKNCRIITHKSRTRVSLITFLNDPNPIIDVGLNDCLRHGQEIVGRHDIIPIKTEQWTSPEGFILNENVLDKEEFEKTHALRCVQMPDNLLVELMRFRTRPKRNYELPLQVRCYMHVVGRLIEIRIECTVGGTYYTKLNEVFCQDIQIRFPLPDSWVYMFRVEKRFRYGAVHSTKHKLGKIKGFDRFLVHKSAHQGAIMEASCGMAKYEQAFKSLVWRIEQLPVKNKDVYKTQLFICKLQLQEYDTMPEKYDEIAYIQYSLPICASSKTQVRSISVNCCEEPPEKWVKLKSRFEYELDINYSFDQTELPAVDKERCAELQHLSQTESEGDNNEENEDNDD